MAKTLGVQRNSLREAIFCLKARGLLASKWGSGVFVTDRLQGAISLPWRQLVADHPDMRWDTLEFRREMEGATVHYAALRADKNDLKKDRSYCQTPDQSELDGRKKRRVQCRHRFP